MYLYLIGAENGLFKIGKASNVNARFAQIKTSSPVQVFLVYVTPYDESVQDLERHYHELFATKRIKGEWFALNKDDVLCIIPETEVQRREVIDLLSPIFAIWEGTWTSRTARAIYKYTDPALPTKWQKDQEKRHLDFVNRTIETFVNLPDDKFMVLDDWGVSIMFKGERVWSGNHPIVVESVDDIVKRYQQGALNA
jgi:hypothetical protein